MLCLCVEFGLLVEWFELIVGERGFVYIKVNGINGILLVSILGNLVDCFEDEVLILLMFFLVEVNNLVVSINNDFLLVLILVFIVILVDLSIENMLV